MVGLKKDLFSVFLIDIVYLLYLVLDGRQVVFLGDRQGLICASQSFLKASFGTKSDPLAGQAQR